MLNVSTAIVPFTAALPAMFVADLDRAAGFAIEEKAPATRRAYRSDFAIFEAMVRPSWIERTAGLA